MSATMPEKLPTVVLAGRPNVGKSTLFNRLLHKRRAITDPTPGVTRDPVAVETTLLGLPLRLVDTGGVRLDVESPLDRAVTERALQTINEADLIVLLFAAGELTPEDEEFAARLRPRQDRLLVAVNKTEGGRREAEAWNLLTLGFPRVYPISAEHGDHVGELAEAIVNRLAGAVTPSAGAPPPPPPLGGHGLPDPPLARATRANGGSGRPPASRQGVWGAAPPTLGVTPPAPPIRVALLGKPNTGKSTLANRLTASAGSLVSDAPGTTRDVVEGAFAWKGRRFQVLDTAGIRRRAKVVDDVEYYSVNRAVGTLDEADLVFLIIDAAEGLTDQDKKIAALAHERGRGVILALNKWDAQPKVKNGFEAARDRIRYFFGQMEYAPVVALSGRDGEGVAALLDTALRVYAQLCRRVETSTLNQALARWLEERPPPQGAARFKIRYATQVEANPVRFAFFVSRKDAVTGPYLAYLRNRIRADLGFSMVPVAIDLRVSGAR